MRCRAMVLGLTVLGVAGCATYQPKPLPEHAKFSRSIASIVIDPSTLPFRDLSSHPFNPADGLDMDEIAMLAVANNPQLKETRDNLGISRAQSFAAGLLPDPQLGVGLDHPTNGTAINPNAFNVTLGYDVTALLLHSSRKNAAVAEEHRVNLELLWQEWQVVSQARLLFTRLTAQAALMAQIRDARELLADRYQRSRRALAAGNVTVDIAGADLIALQDVERQINEAERSRLQNIAALNELLGLAPDTTLKFVGEPAIRAIDAAKIRAGLEQRLNKRPDLQALQAGYRSQEEKFRGAVLAQFPAINLGLTRARDNTGIYSSGFGLTLTLPIFNRNRGNIAIENANRKRLFDEYQNRLNNAYSGISTALENLPLLQNQLQRTRQGVIELKSAAQRAATAYREGNLAAPDYVRLQSALMGKQTEAINLQEALLEQQIALETLLGPGLGKQSTNRSVP